MPSVSATSRKSWLALTLLVVGASVLSGTASAICTAAVMRQPAPQVSQERAAVNPTKELHDELAKLKIQNVVLTKERDEARQGMKDLTERNRVLSRDKAELQAKFEETDKDCRQFAKEIVNRENRRKNTIKMHVERLSQNDQHNIDVLLDRAKSGAISKGELEFLENILSKDSADLMSYFLPVLDKPDRDLLGRVSADDAAH